MQLSIIRFVPKYLDQTLVNFSASPAGDWQTGCLWWGVVESRFHVDLKLNFALENDSMVFLPGPITRRINVLYESRVKWTWHHSKLAVEEVSFFGGLNKEWYSFNYYLFTIEQWALRTWVWCSCVQVHKSNFQWWWFHWLSWHVMPLMLCSMSSYLEWINDFMI